MGKFQRKDAAAWDILQCKLFDIFIYKYAVVLVGPDSYMNLFEVRYSTMTATDWVTSNSFVLRWISGFCGASYGAETPVNSWKHRAVGCKYTQGDGCNGRTFDLPSPSLLVQTFRITFFNHIQGCVNKNFYEFQ